MRAVEPFSFLIVSWDAKERKARTYVNRSTEFIMLQSFFAPASVAVIGAAREENKVGHEVLDNVIDSGFSGPIYPVNPKATEIHGLKCYPNLEEVPEVPELAVVVVPAPLVPDILDDCGRKGTRAVIVISAGFKETGIEGRKLEDELRRIAERHGIRIIGPNCLGLIDTATPINASFAKGMPRKGEIAFISQSGALCTAILDWAKAEEVGFSKLISFGNKADVNETELIEFFVEDPATKVIAVYLEGVGNGPEFMQVVGRAAKRKPVIVYKAGGTAAGARAVSSHTGTLAGSEAAFKAAFYQAGIIQAPSMESLFSYARGFAYQPVPEGKRVAIITNAGGPGIIATDTCERKGIPLASFSSETVSFLQEHLPAAANVYNPVDVLGDALAERYKLACDKVLGDENVDALIFILTPQAMTQIEETAEGLVAASGQNGKPVLACFMGKAGVEDAVKLLNRNHIPNFSYPEPAVDTLAAMTRYAEYRDRQALTTRLFRVDRAAAGRVLAATYEEGRRELGELEAKQVLAAYGIQVARSKLATSLEQAQAIAEELGGPLAVKIASPDILHKTDVGGVKLGVENPEQVARAYEEVIANARRLMPNAIIWGAVIQEMLASGREVIVGVSKDPQFSHMLMVGLGGVYVEVLKDISFRILPITPSDAANMLRELETYKLLEGVRGEKPGDLGALVEVLLRVSQLVCDFPQIVEMDINPLELYPRGEGCKAVDARMVLAER